MIRTDFTQGNQFTVESPTEWMASPGYQKSLRELLEEQLQAVRAEGAEAPAADRRTEQPDKLTLNFTYEPECNWHLDQAFLSNAGKILPLGLDMSSRFYLQDYYKNWYESVQPAREEPPKPEDTVQPAREEPPKPEDTVAAGLAPMLQSFLAEKDPSCDQSLIRKALRLVTQNPTGAGAREALKLLCLKKKEKQIPAARIEKCLKRLLEAADQGEKRQEKILALLHDRRKASSAHGGRRTERMQQQLAAFRAFLDKAGHVYDGRAPYAAALRFWNRQKEKFDKAAKAHGQQKGYSSHKPLADAYHQSMAKPSVR